MPRKTVNGLDIAYEVIGDGRPWVVTPGGRFSKDYPGIRELAHALAERGNRVLIWDRPNCGESEVCFAGPSESDVQADTLAALVHELDMAPAVLAGGSGGSRVSLLAAARHRGTASALTLWWISGGAYGLTFLAYFYCSSSIVAAWNGGMEAVVELPDWAEVLERRPANRERILAYDPKEFIATMERWTTSFFPCGTDLVPGLPDADIRSLDIPSLVFRSGASDPNHPRRSSEQLAALLPRPELVEPPWGDREWLDAQGAGPRGRCARWPLLAPNLHEWVDKTLV